MPVLDINFSEELSEEETKALLAQLEADEEVEKVAQSESRSIAGGIALLTLAVKVATITVPLIIKLVGYLKKESTIEITCTKGGGKRKVTFKGSMSPKKVEEYYKIVCDD